MIYVVLVLPVFKISRSTFITFASLISLLSFSVLAVKPLYTSDACILTGQFLLRGLRNLSSRLSEGVQSLKRVRMPCPGIPKVTVINSVLLHEMTLQFCRAAFTKE